MDINVKIYVNGKNYKTLCKTVINADTVQCEISFDNHSFDVEFDNTAITLKNIDGLKVDTVKTLRFKANFTSMKKFKWDLMEIVTDIVGLLADRHIGYKNMEELYDNAIKNHCIKPEATESETATEPETAEAEETTDPEVGKFVYDVRIHNDYGWDTYTVRADGLESAEYKAVRRMELETDEEEYSSIDVIRIYKEDSNELLKEIISKEREDPETADQGETAEKKMDDVVFETLIRNAKALPPCDFPPAIVLHQASEDMTDRQKKEYSHILLNNGLAIYHNGEIVTANGGFHLYTPVPNEPKTEINNKKFEINSKYGLTANTSTEINNEYDKTKELLAVEQFKRLTGTLFKSLFKTIGLEETRRIPIIISNNMVFFNYNGTQYKYNPAQCKVYKKDGRKYQRINWKDFTDDNSPADQNQARGRSPPFTPDIRSATIQ